ncbi:hypothetical protein CEP53_011316 [Fusarium sp. AF-6]|nr:hypothetical protein CEP53_011316 [Fusarium sp. AF-6]
MRTRLSNNSVAAANLEMLNDGHICSLLDEWRFAPFLFEFRPGCGLYRLPHPQKQGLIRASGQGESLASALKNYDFDLQDRIVLSYCIARAYWQFYDSELMRRKWSSESIWFMPTTNFEQKAVLPLQAFVSFPFGAPDDPAEDFIHDLSIPINHRCPRIFALGILLLEIGLGRPIPTVAFQNGQNPNAQANFNHAAATSLLGKLRNTEWEGFSNKTFFLDAVKYCLDYDNFFQESYYVTGHNDDMSTRIKNLCDRVVRPLEWLEINGFKYKSTELRYLRKAAKTALDPSPAPETYVCPEVGTFYSDRNSESDWMQKLQGISSHIDKRWSGAERRSPIRIAILDTGINCEMPYYQDGDSGEDSRGQIECFRDFVDPGSAFQRDSFGHGSLMASSGNSSDEAEAFPARHPDVISIHATSCHGKFLDSNSQRPTHGSYILGTFGNDIPSRITAEFESQYPGVCQPGSSVATAVAAGIAGLMLALIASRPENFSSPASDKANVFFVIVEARPWMSQKIQQLINAVSECHKLSAKIDQTADRFLAERDSKGDHKKIEKQRDVIRSQAIGSILLCLWEDCKRTKKWEVHLGTQLNTVIGLLENIEKQTTPSTLTNQTKLPEGDNNGIVAATLDGLQNDAEISVDRVKFRDGILLLIEVGRSVSLVELGKDITKALGIGKGIPQVIRNELVEVIWRKDWEMDMSIPGVSATGTLPNLDTATVAQGIGTSARFDGINTREEAISKAFGDTYGWILYSKPPEQDGKPLWGSFLERLADDSNTIYWITGKPGSGKSTIMKFLLQQPLLREHLSSGLGNLRLLIFVAGSFEENKAFTEHLALDPESTSQLISHIVTKANGIFQWVSLVVPLLLDHLADGESPSQPIDIQQVLQDLPSDLNILYDTIWARVQPENLPMGSSMMQVTKTVEGPVSFLTMLLVVSIEEFRTNSNAKLLLKFQWKKKVIDCTKGVLQLKCILELNSEEDGSIDFIHRTAREWASKPETWKRICNSSPNIFDAQLYLLEVDTVLLPYRSTTWSDFDAQLRDAIMNIFWLASKVADIPENAEWIIICLNALEETCKKLGGEDPIKKRSCWAPAQFDADNTFLGLAAQISILPYIEWALLSVHGREHRKFSKGSLGLLENAIFGPLYYNPPTVPLESGDHPISREQRLATVRYLLEHGFYQSEVHTWSGVRDLKDTLENTPPTDHEFEYYAAIMAYLDDITKMTQMKAKLTLTSKHYKSGIKGVIDRE